MIQKKSDDAVSPVIGVMLMIVITVVIAAVVTAFATGMVTDTEPAPTAVLDVKIYDYFEGLPGMGGPDLHITHVSGDAVDTKDIELRFSWVCENEECEHDSHYSVYSAQGFKDTGKTINSAGGNRNQALYVKTYVKSDMRREFGSVQAKDDYYFGDAVLYPGMRLTASTDFLVKAPNTGSQFMNCIFNNYDTSAQTGTAEVWSDGGPTPDVTDSGCEVCWQQISDCTCEAGWKEVSITAGGIMDCLEKGTAVDVMIIHTPSNKAIYDKTVVVE